MHNEESVGEKILNMNVHVHGRAQCVGPEMAYSQFKAGWGWALQAGYRATTQ